RPLAGGACRWWGGDGGHAASSDAGRRRGRVAGRYTTGRREDSLPHATMGGPGIRAAPTVGPVRARGSDRARQGRRAESEMSSVPTHARVVIIGAGIVGNSMAWHLANLGWRDIVLVEKGVLPNPGGSTGHASNFIFLTDHSKEMAAFTIDSAHQ